MITSIPTTIVLKDKEVILSEIVVLPNKAKTQSIKSLVKKKMQYGLSMNSDYLFKLGQDMTYDYFLKRIVIPINFRNEYSNDGSIIIQLFKSGNKNDFLFNQVGETQIIPVSEIKRENKISVAFSGLIVGKNDEMYIFLKRVVSEKVYSSDSSTLSVNPFVYISSRSINDQDDGFVKRMGRADEWINLSTWLGYSPSLNITLNIIPID